MLFSGCSVHKPIPYQDRKEYKIDGKESQGVVTLRGRIRFALLRLALCYSVVPLGSAHKPITYEDSKRMCQSNRCNLVRIELLQFNLIILSKFRFRTVQSNFVMPAL